MPIRGLTDRPASFPEIGAIRKGAPKPEDGKRPGADLKFFRVEFDEREEKTRADFEKVYPKQPVELNILFPFNDVERNFDAWREAYIAGALVHRCDGERVWYEIDPRTGERLVVNGDPYKLCDGGALCKPIGRMKIMIPELMRLAYLVVHTTSVHDIVNLSRQLEALSVINGGKLSGIPLKLRRRPVEISTPSGENGKRARREKWLLSVEADPEWVAAKIAEMKRIAMPGSAALLEISPAPAESPIIGPAWELDDEDNDTEIEKPAAAPESKKTKAAPAAPAKSNQPNGNGHKAIIKTQNWFAAADEFAEAHPRYQTPEGKPDMHHLLGVVAQCGYREITDANLPEIMSSLNDRERAPNLISPEVPF